MRLLFALPGFHRVHRGAEIALEAIAYQLAARGDHDVTVVGSGFPATARPYAFRHAGALSRRLFECWPRLPLLRHEYAYEDLSFALPLLREHWDTPADLTVTCNYPYSNWVLRTGRLGRPRSAHVFVTQNGDWPAYSRDFEFRFFSCDGLVCTNPLFLDRNRRRWFSTLIPNGIDPNAFYPGESDRTAMGLPTDRPIILMVSALIRSKRVLEGISAVSRVRDAFLVVAGDGPLREEVDRTAERLLEGRFLRASFAPERMPDLYRSADVFLHMAIGESFGNVYLEALASGTPIVAHGDEITRWIVGSHARLVDTACDDQVQEALTRALAGAGDGADERAAFAARNYSWQNVASLYARFFEEVTQRSR